MPLAAGKLTEVQCRLGVDLVGQMERWRSAPSFSELRDGWVCLIAPALGPGSGCLEAHGHAPTPANVGMGRSLASRLRF